jgi:peptidoglycan/LPS O-acetylase OafA/YrhL
MDGHSSSHSADSASHQRLHALDGVRAVMMLLGLVLHSCISFGAVEYGAAWPYQDISTNPFLDTVVFFIHIFRMPIFYAMAGFFAAMLYLRRGPAGLAINRATRILLPFIAGWILLMPLIVTGFVFANGAKAGTLADGLAAVAARFAAGSLYVDSTAHLWFLEYLLLFYIAALLAAPPVRRLPESWKSASLALFARSMRSRWRPLWFAIPTALTLCLMSYGGLETSTSFVPAPRVLLAYAVFFFFGWLLYLRRDLLPTFTRHAWLQIVLALLLTPVNMLAIGRFLDASDPGGRAAFATIVITGALMVWLLLFGITGLFLRHLDRYIPAVRYIVDASYWLYLIHLPFTIWLPGLLSGLAWPAMLKAAAVFLLSSPFWLLSYHFCVRATFIGKLLNGRRYPLRLGL